MPVKPRRVLLLSGVGAAATTSSRIVFQPPHCGQRPNMAGDVFPQLAHTYRTCVFAIRCSLLLVYQSPSHLAKVMISITIFDIAFIFFII
jgi:hypothetical protein